MDEADPTHPELLQFLAFPLLSPLLLFFLPPPSEAAWVGKMRRNMLTKGLKHHLLFHLQKTATGEGGEAAMGFLVGVAI